VRFATSNVGSNVQSGYVLATARGNDAVPAGLELFSFSDNGVTVSETAVSAGSSGTNFQTYVDRTGNLRSGFAIANPSASPTSATLELLAIDGSPTNMITSMQIPSRGHIARFIDDLFPTIPERFQGMLRIVATHPVGLTSLRFQANDDGKFVLTGVGALGQ